MTLDELAREYHRRTEEYDRTVCTGPIVRGSIQPRGNREFVLVNRNALRVLREIMHRAHALGFTRCQVHEAIGRNA